MPRVVEEEDGAITVGEAGDSVLGTSIEALFADLMQEGTDDNFPKFLVVGAKEDGDPGLIRC